MNVAILFLHLHIHHKCVDPQDCSITSCLVSPVSPCCNHRQTSPFRIKTLQFERNKCSGTSASTLLCTFVDNVPNDSTISGHSLMNFDDNLDGCYFNFQIVGDNADDEGGDDDMEALFTLYFISAPSGKQTNPCDEFNNIRQEFLSLQKESDDIVQLSHSVLLRFCKRFENFVSINCFRELNKCIDSIQNFWLERKAPNAVDPIHPCVNNSNELFRIVFKFQGIVSLRFGIMEGAHRHLSYYCLLLNLQLKTIGEDDVSSDPYLIRQPEDDDDAKLCDDLFLKYFIYVGQHNEDPKRIVEAAIVVSKQSENTTYKWSVYNEDNHE